MLNKYIDWLAENGFFRHKVADRQFIFIRVQYNLVEQIEPEYIVNFVYKYILNLPYEFDNITRDKLIAWYSSNEKILFSQNKLFLIPINDNDFYADTFSKSAIFYKNLIIEITKDSIKSVNYKDFTGGYIWKSQKLDRNIKLKDYQDKGIFERFLAFIVDKDNLKPLHSAIGYLIPTYKNPALVPAVVLNDKEISDNPEGGTGKGIFWKAIRYFKKTAVIDGKLWNPYKNFSFQDIDPDTKLIVFDDVASNFKFETLFPVITEGVPVEYKGQRSFHIPFADSPKVLITTNYALKGEGNSIERRKLDFELVQYFTKEKTPQDEFKKLLFDEFTAGEWIQFDNFIIKCVQLFLKESIVEPKNKNLALKRLTANTDPNFIDFMENFTDYEDKRDYEDKAEFPLKIICFNTYIDKTWFLNEFRNTTNLKNTSSRKLTAWAKTWCDFYNFIYTDTKSNGKTNFMIGIEPETTNEELPF